MIKKNPNLTSEQKLVMFEDGTEAPGTSELNNEKREGAYYCANCEIKLLTHQLNMKVVRVGHLFMSRYLMFLKQKQIIF